MQTSYYSKNAKNPNAVSIAAKCPKWYKGREYKKLAPKYWFFKKYKEDGDEESYTKSYYKEVLNKLNPREVYNELGEDAVILCWEAPDKFCHRHIVAEWLSDNLVIEIKEYGEKDIDDLIDEWHTGDSALELYEYLGMSIEDYERFVKGEK
jgi:hypothetical protein